MPSPDLLFAALWQGAALALVVWVLLRGFRRLPAHFRAWLWWAVSLKTLVVLIVPATLPIALRAASASTGETDGPLPTMVGGRPLRLPHGGAAAAAFHLTGAQGGQIVWAVGVAVVLVGFLRQAARLRGVMARSMPLEDPLVEAEVGRLMGPLGLRRAPRLRTSGEVGTPMVVRPWQPTVVLPEGFALRVTPEELAMALAHELAHLRRRDLLLGLVPSLAQGLLWFNPVAWIAAREWATEREAAADAAALAATGGLPAAYGRLLVKVADADRRPAFAPASALGATAAYHTLRRRVENMKHPILQPSRPLRAAGLLATGLALLAALPWEVTAQTAKESPRAVAERLIEAERKAILTQDENYRERTETPDYTEDDWQGGPPQSRAASMATYHATNQNERYQSVEAKVRKVEPRPRGMLITVDYHALFTVKEPGEARTRQADVRSRVEELWTNGSGKWMVRSEKSLTVSGVVNGVHLVDGKVVP